MMGGGRTGAIFCKGYALQRFPAQEGVMTDKLAVINIRRILEDWKLTNTWAIAAANIERHCSVDDIGKI